MSDTRKTDTPDGPSASIRLSSPPPETYDALADLFLADGPFGAQRTHTDGTSVRAAQPAQRASLTVEALVLGHLPVVASAWASQYARQVAQASARPVAMLRLHAGFVSLELVGAPDGLDLPRASSLEEGLGEAAKHVRHWLLRVDDTDEPTLGELEGVDALTLLTGADEAATVASYRTIKNMTQRRDAEEGEPTGPRITLAVMGSRPDKAREAGDKLSRAAQTFLGRSVVVGVHAARIGPGRSHTLYRGESETTVESALDALRRAAESVRPTTPALRVTEHEPELNAAATNEASVEPASDAFPVHAFAPAEPVDVELPEPPEVHVRPIEPKTKRAAADCSESLARHIPLLSPMTVHCPHAPRVELAIDDEGALHLLSDAEPEEAMSQLEAARSWADLNRSVLEAVDGRLTASEPTLHLFTSRPKDARPLIDAELRVHLLAPVSPHEGSWLCVELN